MFHLPKYDFRGNPIKGYGSDGMRLFQNIFNPFNYSEESNDVVAEEILRLGYNMPKLREVSWMVIVKFKIL